MAIAIFGQFLGISLLSACLGTISLHLDQPICADSPGLPSYGAIASFFSLTETVPIYRIVRLSDLSTLSGGGICRRENLEARAIADQIICA